MKELVERGEQNAFAMQSGLNKNDLGWGSSQFHKMVCALLVLILMHVEYFSFQATCQNRIALCLCKSKQCYMYRAG